MAEFSPFSRPTPSRAHSCWEVKVLTVSAGSVLMFSDADIGARDRQTSFGDVKGVSGS